MTMTRSHFPGYAYAVTVTDTASTMKFCGTNPLKTFARNIIIINSIFPPKERDRLKTIYNWRRGLTTTFIVHIRMTVNERELLSVHTLAKRC